MTPATRARINRTLDSLELMLIGQPDNEVLRARVDELYMQLGE